MTRVCRVVARGRGAAAHNSSSVVLISEGWLADQEPAFDALCASLWGELLELVPFNLLRQNQQRVSIYSLFVPSAREGPAVTGTSPDSPAGSTWDGSKLTLAADRVTKLLTDSILPTAEGSQGRSVASLSFPTGPAVVGTVVSSSRLEPAGSPSQLSSTTSHPCLPAHSGRASDTGSRRPRTRTGLGWWPGPWLAASD